MSNKIGFTTVFVSLAVFLLAACGLTGKRELVVRHTIHEDAGAATAQATAGADLPALGLESITADTAIDTRMFVYRKADASALLYSYDGTHTWSSAPQVMLEHLARKTAARRLGDRVRITGYPAEETPVMRLRARLLRFDEVRAEESDQGEAVVVLEYELISWRQGETPDESGWIYHGPRQVRTTAPVHHAPEKEIHGFDPEAYSAAMSAAARDAVDKLCDAVAQALPKRTVTGGN
jgi:hypothetical protein